MAQTAKHITSVDPHDGRGTPIPSDTYEGFRTNLNDYGVENVAAYKGLSTDLTKYGWNRDYDLVFIDGAHDEESVRTDIDVALSLLKDGGLLVFHDYNNGIDPDVKKVVDEFIEQGATLVSTHMTVAVVKPPSRVLEEISNG